VGYEQAAKDLRTYFDSEWSETPVHYPNQEEGEDLGEFEKPTNDDWVRFTVNQGDSEQNTLEENPEFRHFGTIIVQVFVPIGAGDGRALKLIDMISSLFRGRTIGESLFRSPEVTTPGRDGKWYQKNVTIPYLRDEVPA
jgi:hypothetical protein